MPRALQEWFHDTASALLYSLAESHAADPTLEKPFNDLTSFVVEQHSRLPDYLRWPLMVATFGFDCASLLSNGRPFHSLAPEHRAKQIAKWKSSPISAKRDLVKYFESLGTYKLYTRLLQVEAPEAGLGKGNNAGRPVVAAQSPIIPSGRGRPTEREPEYLNCEIAVVGSGPGGSITACTLAEAGRDVLLIEEGPFFPPDSFPAFSEQEMTNLYRCGGQTVALGKSKIAYVEGRCVGGGSEINSGLYHRVPSEVLERWSKAFNLAWASEEDLRPHFEACERDLSVSFLPDRAPAASLKLHEGAQKLGWRSLEVPRWFNYTHGRLPERQSMTRTYIPRFIKAGGRLLCDTRVGRIHSSGRYWRLDARGMDGKRLEIRCETLFLAGGAIQTPALLRRSGIQGNIGNSLRLHPTIKVVARFPDQVNSVTMGVPIHQVKEFAPELSFGCSISTPPYLALGLLHRANEAKLADSWRYMANYYAMSAGNSTGTIRSLPGFSEPLVRYSLRTEERAMLTKGLCHLCRALFAAGAVRIHAGTEESYQFTNDCDLAELPTVLEARSASLMTIHLFSSCPMGENREKTATNSFGRVHGFTNLFVADASLLCTAPTVNPQGTVMAFALRNALHFLRKL